MIVEINLNAFYEGTAKLIDLEAYKQRAIEQAGSGNEVILTGQAPVWLYLAVAHSLHGKVKKLLYRSPALVNEEGKQIDVVIFDHDAF